MTRLRHMNAVARAWGVGGLTLVSAFAFAGMMNGGCGGKSSEHPSGATGGIGNVGGTTSAAGTTAMGGTATSSTATCFSPTHDAYKARPGQPGGCPCTNERSVCVGGIAFFCNGYWVAAYDGPCTPPQSTGGATSLGAGGTGTSCIVTMGNLCFVLANPEPYCGDGLLDGDNGEQCDDGNRKGGDGCSGDCRVELNWGCTLPGSCKPIIGSLDAGYCGDGVKSGDEECDYGADNRSLVDAYYSSCLQDCTLGPRCGDGVAQPPFEQCDEYLQTTTCSANCMNLIPVL